ncbi:MAG: hypothetical protein OEZ06_29240, partial [Myxococcales bacterium]|nr:hypothetical protein [Myxococcales bacterium]
EKEKEKDSSGTVETNSEVVDGGAAPVGEVTGDAEAEATWIEGSVLSPREQMIERSRALMAFVNETFEEEA